MRTVTAPRRGRRGRWVWSLSGVVTIALLAIPGTYLVTTAGSPTNSPAQLSAVPTRTITVTQPVTSLNIESYGAPITIVAGPVRHVQVTEAITFDPDNGGPPHVAQSVSRGLLTLSAPECGRSPCSVGYSVTVPSDVAVTAESDGGPVTVSGVAGANLDSQGGPMDLSGIGGPLTASTEGGQLTVSGAGEANLDSGNGSVRATDIRGPLTVNTEGGDLTLDGLAGPLDADTGNGNLLARHVAAVTAAVSTEGGDADIAFTTAPELVTVNTGGGNARIGFAVAPLSVDVNTEGGDALLTVPGGPYALDADSVGGPQSVAIPTDPAAHRSITVTSGGGTLLVEPAAR